ncbi:hypothetical protein [Dyadobacter fanqingshengii]|uniref:Uncharacterized protein n=1 Tax=Dyadobacter fanqingshengii TaxID=2906443 RepID=A0A9X1P7H4_9BACT|nr:hypothetical protein [Dyadobacter fanqingshengii]MCF0039791.1 hypothetical protein [Dyadobacter fanqingshengii]USJ38446.1 hypothetical protein NFI81_11825 [Dyadobacter fanqingshengii]
MEYKKEKEESADVQVGPFLLSRNTYRFIIRFGGPFFTVLGLVLSIFQVYQATADSKENQDRMVEILAKMSTKNIGEFPANLNKINILLENAKDSVHILADVPAYGQFSSPDDYLKYKRFLDGINAGSKRKIEVKMVTYGADKRIEKIREQFSQAKIIYTELNPNGTLKKKIDNYFEKLFTRRQNEKIDIKEYDLYRYIEEVNKNLVYSIKTTTTIDYLEENRSNFPMFIWVRDGEEAIFSLINYPNNTTEVAFETVDKPLVSMLENIFQGAYLQASNSPKDSTK